MRYIVPLTIAIMLVLLLLTFKSLADSVLILLSVPFGGMLSSTIYVLFLIPCLFAIGEDIRRLRR